MKNGKERQKRPKKHNKKLDFDPVDGVIPSKIFYNHNLSDGAKVFYGILYNLSQAYGYAFAGTTTFAKYIGRSNRSILYYISELFEAKLIKVEYQGKFRKLYPLVLPVNNSDMFVIPKDVLVKNDVSSTVKLTYGLIQYKSNNKNGYFGFSDIKQVATLIGKSESTARRHLRAYNDLKLVEIKKVDNKTKIYTFNSYSSSFKNKLTEQNQTPKVIPPDVNFDPVSTITPEMEKIIRGWVGR